MSSATLANLSFNFNPAPQPFNRPSSPPSDSGSRRTQLTPEVVLAIFEGRPKRSELDGTFVPCAKLVRKLSDQFQVKERTVRDIWNRRSWSNVTRPLWTPSEIVAEFGAYQGMNSTFMHVLPAQTRKRGRPMGSKDAIKRRPKIAPVRGEPAVAVLTETAVAALTVREISNLVAEDTSDEDSLMLESYLHGDEPEGFGDELDSDSASCEEVASEEQTDGNWANPADFDPWCAGSPFSC